MILKLNQRKQKQLNKNQQRPYLQNHPILRSKSLKFLKKQMIILKVLNKKGQKKKTQILQ